MRNVILSLSLLVAVSLVSCKENASSKINASNVEGAAQRDEAAKQLPVMTFDKSEFDFGNIEQGTPQETKFAFTNTGNAPLIITNATSSCGCTIPSYPKNEPIAPGESGEIVVNYNGSGLNQVTKTITVTANTEKASEILRIKAFVNPKSGTEAKAPMK